DAAGGRLGLGELELGDLHLGRVVGEALRRHRARRRPLHADRLAHERDGVALDRELAGDGAARRTEEGGRGDLDLTGLAGLRRQIELSPGDLDLELALAGLERGARRGVLGLEDAAVADAAERARD